MIKTELSSSNGLKMCWTKQKGGMYLRARWTRLRRRWAWAHQWRYWSGRAPNTWGWNPPPAEWCRASQKPVTATASLQKTNLSIMWWMLEDVAKGLFIFFTHNFVKKFLTIKKKKGYWWHLPFSDAGAKSMKLRHRSPVKNKQTKKIKLPSVARWRSHIRARSDWQYRTLNSTFTSGPWRVFSGGLSPLLPHDPGGRIHRRWRAWDIG